MRVFKLGIDPTDLRCVRACRLGIDPTDLSCVCVCRLGIDPTDLSDLSSDSDGDTSRPSSSCLPQEGSSVASGSGLDANVIPTVRTSSNHTVEASAGGSTTHVHVDAIQESTSTTHVEAAFAEAKSSSVGRESTPVITNKVCIVSTC